MITPILERLLMTGRATKFNKVHGYSAAGIITCPKDRWLIVTSIMYYPFFDQSTSDPRDLVVGNFMNLRMQSKNNCENYTFKNSVQVNLAGTNDINTDSPPVVYDVFDIHKSDVILQITKNNSVALAADFVFGNLLAQAQAELRPGGYGTTDPVVRRITFNAGGTDYFPQGLVASPDLVPTTRAREDCTFDIDGAVTQPTNNSQLPLVNFTVVSVNSKDILNN